MSIAADQLAAALVADASAMSRLVALYELDALLGRLAKNLSAIGASGTYVTMAGGDLYQLAASAYGDAEEWATIARANGLTDPMITGVQSILVPPSPGGAGGVLDELVPAGVLGPAPSPYVPTPGAGMADGSDPGQSGIWSAL